MKGYVKCVIANRFTFCGFLLLGFFLVTTLYSGSPQIAFQIAFVLGQYGVFLGVGLLGITALSLETYNVYKRTIRHIQKHKTIDSRYRFKMSFSYCARQGIKVAVKEMGLNKPKG